MAAVSSAMNGHTVRLGALLATAGISTIVVMNSGAPELSGVQNVPLRSAPGVLMTALSDQSRPVPGVADVVGRGLFELPLPRRRRRQPARLHRLDATVFRHVELGTARRRDQRWSRDWRRPAPSRSPLTGSPPPIPRTARGRRRYQVPATPAPLSGALVLRRFPLNGIVALFTLGMWTLVWLGFGWIHRLEWLFTGRRRRARPSGERVRDE